MANPTLAERIDAKVAFFDAEVLRIAANATAETDRIRATRALLVRAKAVLTPELEALFPILKQEGFL